MLTSLVSRQTSPLRQRRATRHQQRGVVLMIALIMLVALTLAGLALIRTVDSGALISGNVAFQQSAVASADLATEHAIAELVQSGQIPAPATPIYDLTGAAYAGNAVPGSTLGYVANGLSGGNPGPTPGTAETWNTWWTAQAAAGAVKADATGPDQAGNTSSYVIHRLCFLAVAAGTGGNACAQASGIGGGDGSSTTLGSQNPTAIIKVYYRITVRTVGPRGTTSLVQSVVTL